MPLTCCYSSPRSDGHAYSIFGAFIAGTVISASRIAQRQLAALRTLVLSVLAPLFLATAGPRVDVTVLGRPVVALTGLRLGVLNTTTYTIVVLVALVTSIMAPPVLRHAMFRITQTDEELVRKIDHSTWDGDERVQHAA